jgi:hypothetical protein
MILYTAIQDSFNYPTIRYRQKMKSAKQKADIKYRNSVLRANREEARQWLRTEHARSLWGILSDVPHETMLESVDSLISSVQRSWSATHNMQKTSRTAGRISSMLRGLSY